VVPDFMPDVWLNNLFVDEGRITLQLANGLREQT
jgi:hypothetical protein